MGILHLKKAPCFNSKYCIWSVQSTHLQLRYFLQQNAMKQKERQATPMWRVIQPKKKQNHSAIHESVSQFHTEKPPVGLKKKKTELNAVLLKKKIVWNQ